ncbi:hypothetical protein [Candidatus Igneacidithiobacillus taiwanensis]|uniref:hypothetical protein n=1 Tax=Candidatus Igneacidithiobacillus taiwanensis TaxID=1945924 RepID=UPI0028980799|nr:hypothetical protein [Candidatus Igneacidithiobacillus taiwanensis]MCE5360645.1 hypothetical protein [Acidithiobacillus sp.]
MHNTTKIGLASLFALSLGSLPLPGEAMTTAAPMNGQQQIAQGAMHEGNCSRMMGEGNCSRSKAKMSEAHCTSKADIRAHGGKCGKSYMEKKGM